MMPPVEEERRIVIRVEMVPSLAIVGATGRRAKRVAEIAAESDDREDAFERRGMARAGIRSCRSPSELGVIGDDPPTEVCVCERASASSRRGVCTRDGAGERPERRLEQLGMRAVWNSGRGGGVGSATAALPPPPAPAISAARLGSRRWIIEHGVDG